MIPISWVSKKTRLKIQVNSFDLSVACNINRILIGYMFSFIFCLNYMKIKQKLISHVYKVKLNPGHENTLPLPKIHCLT